MPTFHPNHPRKNNRSAYRGGTRFLFWPPLKVGRPFSSV
jgi:hypothetical protein